jgi:ribosomal protein L37E
MINTVCNNCARKSYVTINKKKTCVHCGHTKRTKIINLKELEGVEQNNEL